MKLPATVHVYVKATLQPIRVELWTGPTGTDVAEFYCRLAANAHSSEAGNYARFDFKLSNCEHVASVLEPRVFVQGKPQPMSVYEGPFECRDDKAPASSARGALTELRYQSPDGGIAALVKSTKAPGATPESRIEFHNQAGELLCTLDYSSEDHEHGYGVAKAEWTRDGQYFVFSLTSSGGHQAWHTPTQFYSRLNETVGSLDDVLKEKVSTADFRILATNHIETKVWDGHDKAVRINLDSVPTTRYSKTLLMKCRGGISHKVEEP